MLINVSNNVPIPRPIVCSQCGNRDTFHMLWLGDLSQSFLARQSANDMDDFEAHDNEGETLNIPLTIQCNVCQTSVMTRSVTISVSPWTVY